MAAMLGPEAEEEEVEELTLLGMEVSVTVCPLGCVRV